MDKKRNEKVKCEICKKFYIRYNKSHHIRTQRHKLVSYCKNKISDFNIYGEIHKTATI